MIHASDFRLIPMTLFSEVSPNCRLDLTRQPYSVGAELPAMASPTLTTNYGQHTASISPTVSATCCKGQFIEPLELWLILLLVIGVLILFTCLFGFGFVLGERVALCRLRDCPKEKGDKMIRESLGMSSEQDQSAETDYESKTL